MSDKTNEIPIAGITDNQVADAVKLLREKRLEKHKMFLEEYERLCKNYSLHIDYTVQCDIKTDGTPIFYANRVIQDLPQV